MHVDGFEDILNEFSQAFDSIKSLCKQIRGVLFRLPRDGTVFTETPPGPSEELYDPIIEAFDNAIVDID